MNLKRTQIYLKSNQHHLLKREAERRGISLSELIRQLVGEHFKDNDEGDDLSSIVGLGASGKTDVAKNHDKYLKEEMDVNSG